jgi:hypothetical protein
VTQDEALVLLHEATCGKVARGADLEPLEALFLSIEQHCEGQLAQLARYRRAHIALRRGDIKTADRLFARVSRSRCLGPWPALYGLAVTLRQSTSPGARLQPAIDALARPSDESSQSAAANALELLIVGARLDLDTLESVAGAAPLPGLDPDGEMPAHLFVTFPEGTRQRMTGELGAQLVAEAPADRLRLVLTEDDGRSLLSDGGVQTLSPNTNRLMAARVIHGGTDRDCLRYGTGQSKATLRQALLRARTELPDALDAETGLNRPATVCVAESFMRR